MSTVKMETLCSRFYAVISGTSDDINIRSINIDNLFFFHLMTFFVTFTFDLEERHPLSDFLGAAE